MQSTADLATKLPEIRASRVISHYHRQFGARAKSETVLSLSEATAANFLKTQPELTCIPSMSRT